MCEFVVWTDFNTTTKRFEFACQGRIFVASATEEFLAGVEEKQAKACIYYEIQQQVLADNHPLILDHWHDYLKSEGCSTLALQLTYGKISPPPVSLGFSYDEPPPQFFDTFPVLRATVKQPCECGNASTLTDIIIHLNDTHKWTREAVADWIDGLELDQEAKVDIAEPTW